MAEVSHKTYYVWVIASRDEFAEQLVSKMVRRGFTIGPLGRQLITKPDDSPSCVVAMSVFRVARSEAEKKEYTATGIHQEVCDVIKFIKGKFWGIIVSAAADCTWNTGNASLSDEEKTKIADAKKVN